MQTVMNRSVILFSFFVFFAYLDLSNCQVLTVTVQETSIFGINNVITLTEGENLEFTCSISDNVVIGLTVTPPTVSVQESGPGNNQQYTVNNVNRSISMTQFSCDDDDTTITFEINVEFSPNISNITNGAGAVNGSATVTFTVDANPSITEYNVTVTPNKHNDIMINGELVTLTYTALQRSDNGTYIVTVENSVNTTQATFELDVYFSPIFAVTDTSIKVTVGDRLLIDCSVSESNPMEPTIKISGYGISGQRDITNTPNYIIIESVDINYNNQVYTCIASNGETDDTTITFTVTVLQSSASTMTSTVSQATITSTSSGSTITAATTTPSIIVSTGGLSTGAIVGISVAIIVGVLLILLGVSIIIIVLVCVKKNKSKA